MEGIIRRPLYICDDIANTPASLLKPKSNISEWNIRPGEEKRIYSFLGKRRSSLIRLKIAYIRELDGNTGLFYTVIQSRLTSAL